MSKFHLVLQVSSHSLVALFPCLLCYLFILWCLQKKKAFIWFFSIERTLCFWACLQKVAWLLHTFCCAYQLYILTETNSFVALIACNNTKKSRHLLMRFQPQVNAGLWKSAFLALNVCSFREFTRLLFHGSCAGKIKAANWWESIIFFQKVRWHSKAYQTK